MGILFFVFTLLTVISLFSLSMHHHYRILERENKIYLVYLTKWHEDCKKKAEKRRDRLKPKYRPSDTPKPLKKGGLLD
ncbi:MAG: hypothetical protein AAF443_06870 [Chlamydiota bacterium]